MMVDGRKEILRLAEGQRALFDLARDPQEIHGLAGDSRLSQRLQDWRTAVQNGLAASDRLVPAAPAGISAEDAAQLRALGYLQ
jgi:hypothetical protein